MLNRLLILAGVGVGTIALLGLGTAMGASLPHEAPPSVVELPTDGGSIGPASLAAALDTPCPTEDSDNCYWLGGTNGLGTSFVTVEGHLFPLPISH